MKRLRSVLFVFSTNWLLILSLIPDGPYFPIDHIPLPHPKFSYFMLVTIVSFTLHATHFSLHFDKPQENENLSLIKFGDRGRVYNRTS